MQETGSAGLDHISFARQNRIRNKLYQISQEKALFGSVRVNHIGFRQTKPYQILQS